MVLLLVETAAGYALFKVQNKKLLQADPKEVRNYFITGEDARKNVSLHKFKIFNHTKDVLSDVTALMESKLGKGLKKFLKKTIPDLEINEEFAVSDKVLGVAIKKKFNLNVIFSENAHEIIRGIREHLSELITGLTENDNRTMAVSLSHALNRFKLKFSPEKVDTMIVQAISLLDDLDKELNNFAMRLKEWYGWHFPELSKIVTDTVLYARVVQQIGMRTNARTCQTLKDIVPEVIEQEIREAAEVSMGTDITEDDLKNITELSSRIIELHQYRITLSDYLKFRMEAIAPNLTCLVGEIVGARLISHAGSLINLAKHPASTVQILGAEKALFRALKSKQATPKYGLIYHAHVVGQAIPRLKGKVSRVLAAKISLCTRVDAFGNPNDTSVGEECKCYVERRIDEIKDINMQAPITTSEKPSMKKYVPKYSRETTALDPSADALKRSYQPSDDCDNDETIVESQTKRRRDS